MQQPYAVSNDIGIASRGSSGTLIDDTRHWQDNILRGALLRIEKEEQVYERRATPLEKANLQNVAISANTNILSTDLEPLAAASLLRIMVAMSDSGVFRASITKGEDVQVVDFYEGASLQADSLYMFDMLVHPGDLVNFRYSVDATLRVLRIEEVMLATQ